MSIPEHFKEIFEPKLIEEIEKNAQMREISAGETILDYGQMVRSIPIITKGIVKVSRMDDDGRELLLYYVNPLESCSMTFTCCMEQFPSEIRAMAEEDTELMAIPTRFMDEWLVKYPTWKSFIMKTIRARFNEMLKAIDQIAFQHLDERLVNYLKEKAKVTKSTLLNLSHQQIADEMASSRVVISRLLKKLELDKKLLLYRNQIKLLRDL